MKVTDMSKKLLARTLRCTATLIIANGMGALQLWQGANCWAQQNVTVYPGQNLQAIVNQYPTGTTFTFTPGIYYGQSIVPQSYDTFVGEPGAILSGATLLQNFSWNGTYWTAQVRATQASSYPGYCGGNNPNCTLPEDLFFNNVLKTRVASLSAVQAGDWYLNYSTGTVYMGDNPTGSTVEISILPYAFTGTATNVTVSNLTVEKYACVAGTGAVNGGNGSNYWTVENSEVRFNHGMGIQVGNGMYIHDSYIHTNGELGIGGEGTTITVQSNQIAWNNYADYTIYNEAGGAKFCEVNGLTFRYNYSHDNIGPGFWTDLNSQNIMVDANQFSGNQVGAVVLEITNNATVSNNYIWNDGYNPDGPGIWWGAGILLSDSTNTSVYFNTLSNCMNGIAGILVSRGDGPNGQPYTLQNNNVNSNWITQTTGIAIGIGVESTGYDNSVYTSWGNQFQYNTLYLANPNGNYIYWMGYAMTFNQWWAVLG